MESIAAKAQRRTSVRSYAARFGCRLHYFAYFFDVGFLTLSSFAFYLILLHGVDSHPGPINYGLVVAITFTAYSIFAFSNGHYDWRSFRQQLRQPASTFGAIIFAFGVLLIIGFAFKITDYFSRLWIGSWLTSFAFYVLLSRLIMTWYLSDPDHRGVLARHGVILGAGDHGKAVLEHIRKFDDLGIAIVGFLDDRLSRVPRSVKGVPLLGRTDDLEHLIRDYNVDVVIIALPWSAYERICALKRKLAARAVDLYMAPDKLGLTYSDRPVFRVGGMHVLSLEDRPIGDWDAVVKRIEDLSIAIPLLVLLSPLLALVALAIKLDSKGKALFVQERYGFNNQLINVYKFRSMYTHLRDADADRITIKDDPRVTRVGRFIRRTSIDELPQLFNVLNGTMSIVGPRPHATKAKAGDQLYQDVVDEYASRHRVKPGITGWAQCNGWRGETDTSEKIRKRVEHDLYYIENWSIFLDFLVIARTLLLLGNDKNAY